ncbi:MAG: NAD(P)-binding protein [Gemmatimonadaceae bacterium]
MSHPSGQAIDEAARRGLPRRDGAPKRVVVVGAGMAGLVAAYELLRAGHDPVVHAA